MKETRNWLIVCLILVGVIVTIWYNVGDQTLTVQKKKEDCTGKVAPLKGYCAPNFTLSTLDGQKIELYQTDGKPTILNFWASWCSPCQKEMPILESFYKQYKEKIHFRMVNVTAQDDVDTVHQYIEDHQYTFPVLLDPPDEKNRSVSLTDYKVKGIPMTYGIAPNGKILFQKAGGVSEKEMEELIKILEKSSTGN